MQLRFPCALLLVAIWAVASTAHADGLSVQNLSLLEVLNRGSGAAVVTVGGVHSSKGRAEIEIKVDRLWRNKEQPVCALGQRCRLQLPQEQAMVPGKWLVVQRYWNLVDPLSLRSGTQVIVVFEHDSPGAGVNAVIAHSPQNLRKLDLFFSPRWQALHAKKSTVAQLEADLADFDLYQNARVELIRRKKLHSAMIWEAASKSDTHDLLAEHLRELPGNQRGRFLLKAAAALEKLPNPKLKSLLRRHFDAQDVPLAEISALALFLDSLDFSKSDDLSTMYSLASRAVAVLKTKRGRRFSEHFLQAFAHYAPRRPHYGEVDTPIYAYANLLAGPLRRKFLILLMEELEASKPGKVDELSFGLIAKHVRELPLERLRRFSLAVQPLIDPGGFDGCDQVGHLVEIVLRLGKNATIAKTIKPLAATVLGQYQCNVDRGHKAALTVLATGG